MKELLIICVFISFFSRTYAQLEIHTKNMANGRAYLLNTKTQKIDTLNFTNYTFKYSKILPEPTLFHLYFEGINTKNAPIKLVLSEQQTKLNFFTLQKSNEDLGKLSALYPNYPSFDQDPQRNAYFFEFQKHWIAFFDTIINLSSDIESSELLLKREKTHSDFIKKCEQIITKNRDYLISAVIIEFLMNDGLLSLEKIQSFYALLNPNIQNTFIGQKISNEAGLKKGSEAPRFSLIDENKNIYTLENCRGKILLLHFWSSTCAPCIKESPELKSITNTYQNLLIINISMDNDYTSWKKAMKKIGIENMINIFDNQGFKSKIAFDYFIKSIPANYLIDNQGKIFSKREKISDIINDLELLIRK
jgi:peroxiredoxin